MDSLPEIPEEAFTEIIKELERKPIDINYYRSKSGVGRSQAFGLVSRWYLPPDYCRNCWKRAYLYKLLLDFAEKYVPFEYTSITLNQNYKAEPHYDKGNIGSSFLVSFGTFTGGELIAEGKEIDIKNKPVVADFTKILHSVKDFYGQRYSLVFYTLDVKKRGEVEIPKPSVKQVSENNYVFYRGDTPVDKKKGLPYPKKKNKQQ